MKRLTAIFVILTALLMLFACTTPTDDDNGDGDNNGGDGNGTTTSLSGTWGVTVNLPDNQVEYVKYILEHNSDDTFTLIDSGTLYNIIDSSGDVSGDTFTLRALADMFNTEIPIVLSGTIDENYDVSGDMIVNGSNLGTFSMTRTSTSITLYESTISIATITADGDPADWSAVTSGLADAATDASGDVNGTDIQSIQLSTDSGKTILNILINLDDYPAENSDINYEIRVYNYNATTYSATNDVRIDVRYSSSAWQYEIDGGASQSLTVDPGQKCIELSLNISDLTNNFDSTKSIKYHVEIGNDNLINSYDILESTGFYLNMP